MRAEKSLITRARSLRKNSTDAERLLWYHLRNRRMAGYKFKRQFIVGRYIVDFVCIDAKLVVELDGGQHGAQEQYDSKRTEFLEGKGYRVIRFWNNDVLLRTGNVLEEILSRLVDSHPSSRPSPLKGRRGNK
ncbi:endonuclease domain-containing protein [Pseudomonadota bacterium]